MVEQRSFKEPFLYQKGCYISLSKILSYQVHLHVARLQFTIRTVKSEAGVDGLITTSHHLSTPILGWIHSPEIQYQVYVELSQICCEGNKIISLKSFDRLF